MSKSNSMSKSNTMSKTNSMSKSNTMSKGVSNNSWVSNSMSNWVCNSMNNWVSNAMGHRVSNSSGIVRFSFIGNISNISIIIIGMVVDMLDTAIRKVDRVGAFYNTGTIIGLSLVEGSTRVVISNSIGVGVGRGLSIVRLGISTNSMVSNNWSMVDNRSMGNSNWVSNSMSNWVGNSMANSMSKSMSNWVSNSMSKSMSNGVSNNTSSTMKTVGRVSYSSNRSSKSLRLSGASVFSLVWLGDRLVGNLASWTAMITSSNYWTMSDHPKTMRMSMGHSGIMGNSRGSCDQAKEGLEQGCTKYILAGNRDHLIKNWLRDSYSSYHT